MSEEQRRRLVEQGKQQLLAAEAEKRMLYDRQTGGASLARPSVAYIKENVGKQKSQAQIEKEAAAHVYPKMNGKAADQWVVKNAAPEKKPSPEQLRDVWKAKNPELGKTDAAKARAAWTEKSNSTDKQTSREQLRAAWNAKADPSRAQQRERDRARGGLER